MEKISLRAARVAAGLTQEEMAKKIGVTRSWLQKMESGKKKIKLAYVLAWCNVTGFDEENIILPEKSN